MPLRRHILLLLILAIVWCLLSGHNTMLLLSLGMVSCLLSVWVYHRLAGKNPAWIKLSSPFALTRYLVWLSIEIVKSSIDVIRVIFSPSVVDPQFFEVETGNLNQTGKVIYANSITLTPGTVTTRLDGNTIQVHSLTTASRAALQSNQMRDKVSQLKFSTETCAQTD